MHSGELRNSKPPTSMLHAQSSNKELLILCSQLTWAAVGNLCELPNIRELNCAGIKYSAEHASSLTLPQLVSKLNALVIGDTCTLSFVDDSLLNLISMHGKNLTSLDCSGCIDVTDSGELTALDPGFTYISKKI